MKREDSERETLLRTAIYYAGDHRKRNRPLWALVRDICCVGSTSAAEICAGMGWNPEANASDTLPPRKP